MAFSYDNLWRVLKERNMTKEDLKEATGMSSATIAKLGKNETVNMKTLENICRTLECNIEDVIEIVFNNR